MKILKITAAVAATLLVLLAALAVALFFVFDGERIRRELTQAVEQRTGRVLTVSDEVSLALWPQVAVRIGPSTLSEPGGKDNFARWEGLSAAVEVRPLLTGEVVVREVAIQGLEATLVQRRDGTLNIGDLLALTASGPRPASPGQDRPAALPRTRMDAIALEQARLTWRNAGGASTVVELSTRATGIAGQGERLAIGQWTLDATVLAGDSRVTARVNTPLDVHLGQTRLTLPTLSGELDIRHPALPDQRLSLPLTGQATLNWGASTAEASLGSRLDDSPVKLGLLVGAFSPLAFKMDLDVERLNVDRFAGPPAGGAAPSDQKPGKGPAPIDLSGLNALNAQASVRIGELRASGLTLNELRLGVNARQGRVNVSPMNAKLYGGTLAGTASLQTAGNRLALRQTLTGVSIAPLLKDLAGNDKLEGSGNVTLDINTQGPTTDQWLRALQGTARIELKDGAVRGINIAQTLRNAKQLLGNARTAPIESDTAQKTDFSELSASFQISQGIARNNDLSLKAPLVRVAGEGSVNLPEQTLDYLLKPTLVATSQGQGGRDADTLRGVAVPIRLTGPIAQPSWRLEVGAALADSLKSAVQDKAQEKLQEKLQDGVQDKIGDRLRGLLGR